MICFLLPHDVYKDYITGPLENQISGTYITSGNKTQGLPLWDYWQSTDSVMSAILLPKA